MKWHMPNKNIKVEGTMSQNFYVGPNSYFMKCRKMKIF